MKAPVGPVFFLVRCLKLSGSLKELLGAWAGYTGAGWDEVGVGWTSHSFLISFLHGAGQGNILVTFYITGKK